jgi:hypothetical protein
LAEPNTGQFVKLLVQYQNDLLRSDRLPRAAVARHLDDEDVAVESLVVKGRAEGPVVGQVS